MSKNEEKIILKDYDIETFDSENLHDWAPSENMCRQVFDFYAMIGDCTIQLDDLQETLKQNEEGKRNSDEKYLEHIKFLIKGLQDSIKRAKDKVNNLRTIAGCLKNIRQWAWEIDTKNLNDHEDSLSPEEYKANLIKRIKEDQKIIDDIAIVDKDKLMYYYDSYLNIEDQLI